MRALSIKLSLTLGLLVAVQSHADLILTQTPQGSYQGNSLFGSSWSNYTTAMQAAHTLTQTANFENMAQLNAHDAVFVNQELFGHLSALEIANLNAYISSGHKAVLIGENSSWNPWNSDLMTVVGGGSFTSGCDWTAGTPTTSHILTTGITAVNPACGDPINGSANATILFNNGMAGLYNVGAGEALVILESNWIDNSYSTPGNIQFGNNIIAWLGQDLAPDTAAVPEPGTLALFGLGLGGLAAAMRRKPKV